jgi:GAF domain-containing protein
LRQLTLAAEQIAAGNLQATAVVQGQDEIGRLASTFNMMVTQLRTFITTLEQRVADRTKALATSVEVSRRLASILDPNQLLIEVVEQIQTAFNYYHVHIYLLDPSGENLLMAGGTGEAGKAMLAAGHQIPKGHGLVGRAAETNASVLVPDVSQSIGWLPNPLLPETKSEAAVPIAALGQVLGVLDVQQDRVNGLSEEDVSLLQALANQVAISIRNARSYEESKKQAELETLVNTIGQKIQRTTTVEETLQTAVREIGLALGAKRVNAGILRPSGEAGQAIKDPDGIR